MTDKADAMSVNIGNGAIVFVFNVRYYHHAELFILIELIENWETTLRDG